ncbi:hypothetical protein OG435_47210 [Streptomyces sp. NBC_01264]|nr:hypothetical protein [Streptomyces sp. NBC_01264]
MVLLPVRGMAVARVTEVSFASDDRVRDVIHNFNTDGFGSLHPTYKGGWPKTLTLPERREIAKPKPTEHDLLFSTWSLTYLADFLVAEGAVDDISQPHTRRLPTSTAQHHKISDRARSRVRRHRALQRAGRPPRRDRRPDLRRSPSAGHRSDFAPAAGRSPRPGQFLTCNEPPTFSCAAPGSCPARNQQLESENRELREVSPLRSRNDAQPTRRAAAAAHREKCSAVVGPCWRDRRGHSPPHNTPGQESARSVGSRSTVRT